MTATKIAHSGTRESILASIRQNLASSASLDRVHTRHPIEIDQTPLVVPPSFSREGLRQSFKNNLESVGGHCHIVKDENQAAEAVRTTIEGLAAARIAISDSPLVESMVSSATTVETVRNADREYLFGSDVGITSAQWAIAETGTLVLESDDERHRLISLVPPVHICILRADDIRQTLGEILELISSDLSPTVTFITGASRTSDIELTLAIGVHGPRELHVILIADQES